MFIWKQMIKLPPSEKGFAHVLPVILLLAGVVVGTYLVQQKTNLFPRAAGPISSPITGTVTPTPQNPAAYWKFDEGKGVLASNSVLEMTLGCTPGNCTPSTWSEEGKTGKALNFDGVNDYGIVKDNPALKPDSSITVSAWFKTSDLTRNQRIISKTESGDYQISLNENYGCNKNTLCFLIRVGNGYKQASVPTSQLSPNTWYFVAGIYDGSNVKLYLDGVLKAATPATGRITHTTAPLCVGMEATASSCKDNPFIGIIDEVKVYERALSETEITNEYGSSSPSAKRVFVTSTTYDGNLGGLSGADAKCQERANAANLGGTWRAWLSDSTTSAASRVFHTTGAYKLVNGVTMANSWTDLVNGKLLAPPDITELGIVKDAKWVWTHSLGDGSIYYGDNNNYPCANWTSSNGGGSTGDSSRKDNGWTYYGANSCYNSLPLYCFEQ